MFAVPEYRRVIPLHTILTIGSRPWVAEPKGCEVYSTSILATLKVASAYTIFIMPEENNQQKTRTNKFTLTYPDNSILIIESKSFKETVRIALTAPDLKNKCPYKMKCESTGKIMYFDKSLFTAYLDDELDQPDLIDDTQCDGLYRNTEDLNNIDQYSLWKLCHKKYILVDSDVYVSVDAPDQRFMEV